MGYKFFRYCLPITNGVQVKTSAGQELLNVTHASAKTTIKGAEAAGDDLEFIANTTETVPIIRLAGGAGILMHPAIGQPVRIYNGVTTAILDVQDGGTSCQLLSKVNNDDLELATTGTGVIKFGVYAAITAETNAGFITVKDVAGNTRKLCVVA